MAIWHMNKLINIKIIPSLCISGRCITRPLCDTVNYYRGLGGFESQIVTAGDGAGLTALGSSSTYKPHSQCVTMRLGSHLDLPPGNPAKHGESLGHSVSIPPCTTGIAELQLPALAFGFVSFPSLLSLAYWPCPMP